MQRGTLTLVGTQLLRAFRLALILTDTHAFRIEEPPMAAQEVGLIVGAAGAPTFLAVY